MRKEAKILTEKAISSLRLSVDHFNRQWEVGRTEAVLIFLDHAFEMFMKGAILERTGRLRESGQQYTYAFEKCIRIGLSNETAKFLSEDQALTLQTINGLRDAAQHHHVQLSEGLLYVHAQSGVTLFSDLMFCVHGERLHEYVSSRVLPISTIPPLDPITLFRHEMSEVAKLLAPNRRRSVEAKSRLRGLAILDGTINGEISQPGEKRLNALARQIRAGQDFENVFPGIAAVNFVTDGTGIDFSLRITKKEGLPVSLVPEGTPGGSVVAVRRVDELGFYSLGLNDLAEKLSLTPPKTLSVIRFCSLQSDAECFKEIKVGKTTHKRYSRQAVERIRQVLQDHHIDEIWRAQRKDSRKLA